MTKFTFYRNPTLTLVSVPTDGPVLFSLDAAAQLTGVHPEMLLYYSRADLMRRFRGRRPTNSFSRKARSKRFAALNIIAGIWASDAGPCRSSVNCGVKPTSNTSNFVF